jgi:hypothetical protein
MLSVFAMNGAEERAQDSKTCGVFTSIIRKDQEECQWKVEG